MIATKDAAAVASAFAVVVSLFSLWDKRRDTRRQLRIRLSQVVDELNAVALEQRKEERSTGDLGSRLRIAYNSRREMLSREAVDLTKLLGRRVTDGDYRVLAVALETVGDTRGAETCWQRGLEAAAPGSVFQLFVMRGYAQYLFVHGSKMRARELFQKAVDLRAGEGDDQLLLTGETYLRWASIERDTGAARAEVDRLLDEAESRIRGVTFPPRQVRPLRELSDARNARNGD